MHVFFPNDKKVGMKPENAFGGRAPHAASFLFFLEIYYLKF
jgi:hypothetical protein